MKNNSKKDVKRKKDNNSKTLKWLVKKSKSQWIPMIIFILLGVIQSLSAAVIAIYTRAFINAATKTKDIDSLIFNGIMLAVVVISVIIIRLIVNNLELRIKAKLVIVFRTDLFGNILNKDFTEISSYHSGELLNRITSDVEFVADGITTILPSFVNTLTKIVSLSVTLFVLMPKLAAIFFCLGIVTYILGRLFRRIMKDLHKKMQESDGKSRSFMQESIANILAIKVFNKENDIVDKSLVLQQENYRIKMKRRTYAIFAAAGFTLAFEIAYFGTMVWGGISLFNGALDYGTFTALLQLISNIQSPFLNLSGMLPKYFSLLASAERLMEVEDIVDEPIAKDGFINPHEVYSKMKRLSFSNIGFSYGREVILDGGSLDVEKGDFVAIMGISGIGKSTLLKLLLGVYPRYEGEINIVCNDNNIKIGKETRPLFSYVPQGNMLFSGTLLENVIFANPTASDEEIKRVLEISCVTDFMDELPEGLDTVVGEKGQGLSEGQVQRIAVARALLSDAPIILLDEATSALDEATEKRLLTNLHDLPGKTLIIISHKRAALEICNVHVRIEEKKIVSERV